MPSTFHLAGAPSGKMPLVFTCAGLGMISIATFWAAIHGRLHHYNPSWPVSMCFLMAGFGFHILSIFLAVKCLIGHWKHAPGLRHAWAAYVALFVSLAICPCSGGGFFLCIGAPVLD
jgi:hypothetical protein